MKPNFKIEVTNEHPLVNHEMNYKVMKFSGGEIHVAILEDSDHYLQEMNNTFTIKGDIRSSDHLMELLTLKDALDRHIKFSDFFVKEINLDIGYVPYGRQDRVANYGESLSIKVFADILNLAKFDNVTVTDPHSDVTTALINNCRVRDQVTYVKECLSALGDKGNTSIVIPDVGSHKKLVAMKLDNITSHIQFMKNRDTKTGQISGTEGIKLNDNKNINHFVIIDDICDGGRTFIEIAKVIRSEYEGKDYEITLIVSHGIFSKGKEVFEGLIDNVFAMYDWGK